VKVALVIWRGMGGLGVAGGAGEYSAAVSCGRGHQCENVVYKLQIQA
jgi:hypothetical protein